jgi:uncharacterized protein YjbI with pentapeptide repeats
MMMTPVARRPPSLRDLHWQRRSTAARPWWLPFQRNQDIGGWQRAWSTNEQRPKRKAKDNPWYRLATLAGKPTDVDDRIVSENRKTWNGWMASTLPDDLRADLLEKRKWAIDELTSFPMEQLQAIESQLGISRYEPIDFSDTEFEDPFFALGFIFPNSPTFSKATFAEEAYFSGAAFYDASFDRVTFNSTASFGEATFNGTTFFIDATFKASDIRRRVEFDSRQRDRDDIAYFAGATFDSVDFERATFFRESHRGGSVMAASFVGAIFSGYTNFYEARFNGYAGFTNAEFKDETNFTKAQFKLPPLFFNGKLHDGTAWDNVTWPERPRKEQAAEYIRAYECLKQEMDRLKRHGDELDFFARELQARGIILGFWEGITIRLYGSLCRYGRDYMRPLYLLALLVIFGAVPIRAHFGGGWSFATFTGHPIGGGALGLSFANTFGFLGIRKDFIDPGLLQSLPGWLRVVATIQTILGIALLFLFGLGIRNRFRIK